MNIITRDWNWWAYFFRVTHRQTLPLIEQYDDELVAFIAEVLDLRPGDRVLDLGCGSGVHALRLAQRGFQTIGLDIAPRLVEHAAEQAKKAGADNAVFIVGDMRRLPMVLDEQQFNAAIILSTTFGLFDEAGNRAVLEGVERVLIPGGRLLLDLSDPMEIMVQREKWWSELEGGFLLMESWYDPAECIHHGVFRYVDREGNLNVCADEERIRIYTLPELEILLHQAGLLLHAAYGDVTLPPRPYGPRCHERMIVVARKPHPQLDAAHR